MTTEMEKKTKLAEIYADKFKELPLQCYNNLSGDVTILEKYVHKIILETYELAYDKGFMDGYEKRDTEKLDRFPEY